MRKKEQISDARFWLGVFIGAFIAVFGWIVNNYDKVNIYFIITAIVIDVFCGIAIYIFRKKIKRLIDDIREL